MKRRAAWLKSLGEVRCEVCRKLIPPKRIYPSKIPKTCSPNCRDIRSRGRHQVQMSHARLPTPEEIAAATAVLDAAHLAKLTERTYDAPADDAIVITLPIPPAELSPNARVHWSRKQRAVRAYRTDAYVLAIAAGVQDLKLDRATARACFFWPTQRDRDADNAAAMLKPAFDGLVRAGVLVNDTADVLAHEPAWFGVDADKPRVEIHLRRSRP